MFENSLEYAQQLDLEDNLSHLRDRYSIPQQKGCDIIYLCGNSLGLQPKLAKEYLLQELEDWAMLGVEGHFKSNNPWFSYHEWFANPLANLVGAKPTEVVAMNNLTVNLHLLLVSFYQPKGKRNKILFESTAFPSDRYALESQIHFHGLRPEDCLIELHTDSHGYISTESILSKITEIGEELACVMLGGVNYFTGQWFDLEKITQKAHEVGAIAGFDLAHAIGNVPMNLHQWEVDFACWCSYKYLNSGPGAVAGIFVHEKFGDGSKLKRFHGWWGNNSKTRFKMGKEFQASIGAEGWQLSNAPVFNMVAHRAALEIFEEVGLNNLRRKSILLTGYLEFLLLEINRFHQKDLIKILTPANSDERGCQLSLKISTDGKNLFESMVKAGFLSDWREPDVIRISPVPMYNTFKDVWKTANFILEYFTSFYQRKTASTA